jgi:hypothetical protein
MHTIIVLATGFGLLGLCALAGHLVGGTPAIATAALLFLPLWLAGAGINMVLGVKRAGYSVKEEAPMSCWFLRCRPPQRCWRGGCCAKRPLPAVAP